MAAKKQIFFGHDSSFLFYYTSVTRHRVGYTCMIVFLSSNFRILMADAHKRQSTHQSTHHRDLISSRKAASGLATARDTFSLSRSAVNRSICSTMSPYSGLYVSVFTRRDWSSCYKWRGKTHDRVTFLKYFHTQSTTTTAIRMESFAGQLRAGDHGLFGETTRRWSWWTRAVR